MKRLVVVCGYSRPNTDELHPICAARVRAAAQLVRASDVVLLSGAAKPGSARSEAELMADAWPGESEHLRHDRQARQTTENAAAALACARAEQAEEVIALTSWWHAPRAAFIFRPVFAGSGIRVRVRGCASPWSLRLVGLECVYLPLSYAHARAVPRQ